MAGRWIAPCVCGCLILHTEAYLRWKWEDWPWAAGEPFVCGSVCVHTVTSSITALRLSGVVTYTVLALSLSLSLCITIHLSPSAFSSPPLFSRTVHFYALVLPFGLTPHSVVVFSSFGTAGAVLSPSSFLTPLYFRDEILQSFTRLLVSSLADFLLCSTPPCFTGLWRRPQAHPPFHSSLSSSLLYTVQPAISHPLLLWPVL